MKKHLTVAVLCMAWVHAVQDLRAQEDSLAGSEKKSCSAAFSGEIEGSYTYFPDSALYPGQKGEFFAAVFRPKYYLEWGKGRQSVSFEAFAVLDQYDNKRSHADIRELYYRYVFRRLELSAGIRRIYWGVAESNHLADVVNQKDMLEGFDPENKLGQPMASISYSSKVGTWDLMVMPWFRTLTFPGNPGRLRPPFAFNEQKTEYQSEFGNRNPDLAARWSHSFGVFDIGLSDFYGTNRLPLVRFDPMTWSFYPYYEIINQSSLDIQAVTGPMLWKAEAMYRVSKDTARDPVTALVLGGEYTLGNLFSTGADVGLLSEYTYDSRPVYEVFTGLTNDLFFGLRLAVNDAQNTEFLGGVMVGMLNQERKASSAFSGSRVYNFSASRRVGKSWKLSLSGALFDKIDQTEFLYFIRNDSFGKIALSKFL